MSVIQSGPRELGYVEGFKEARDQILTLIQKEQDNPYLNSKNKRRLEELQENIKKLKS